MRGDNTGEMRRCAGPDDEHPDAAAGRFAKLESWGVPLLVLLMLIPVAGSNILSLILSPLVLESDGLVRAMVLL